jgi:hypothetical protein
LLSLASSPISCSLIHLQNRTTTLFSYAVLPPRAPYHPLPSRSSLWHRPFPSLQILSGQKVQVVRCEEINVSGSFFRNKVRPRGGFFPFGTRVNLRSFRRRRRLPNTAPLPRLPEQAPLGQPQEERSVPLPRSQQDPVQGYPWNGARFERAEEICGAC